MTEATRGPRRPAAPTSEARNIRQAQNAEHLPPRLPDRMPRNQPTANVQPTVRQQQPWPFQPQPAVDLPHPPLKAARTQAPMQQTASAPSPSSTPPASRPSLSVEPDPAPIRGEPHIPAKRSAASALIYASVGFLAGAAFWHAVGFWSFVEEAVFSGPRQQASQTFDDFPSRPAARDFDEERFASSPEETVTSTSKITTGSISPIRPVKPGNPPAAKDVEIPKPVAATKAPPDLDKIRPGGLSWSPAVKTSE